MEFNGQYLNYDEYVELGGHLEEMPFNLLELEVRTNIDRETQLRLKTQKKIPNQVKVCIYNLVNAMAYDGNYKDATTSERQQYIDKVIYDSLTGVIVNGTPLTYRGV